MDKVDRKKGTGETSARYRAHCRAFTLTEIGIVIAIIGLIVAMSIPAISRARKQAQARRILNDANQMDGAIQQWALESSLDTGSTIYTTSAATYLESTWSTNDSLGHAFIINTVGNSQIQISSLTKSALQGVGIDWGSY